MNFVISNLDDLEAFMSIVLGVNLDQEEEIDNNVQENYETDINLATYYSPLFPQSQRTDEFKQLFKECFGHSSNICLTLPRPLMCSDCIQKYIEAILFSLY